MIDASTKLVMPGLVNTHHHMYQTLQRNIPAVQDAELFDWLVALYEIWRHLTPEAVRISTQLACAELLKTGCTTTTDHHYVFPRGVSRGADRRPVRRDPADRDPLLRHPRAACPAARARGGLPPNSVVQDEETILAASEALIAAYHDPEPFSMRRLALAPCSPFSVSEELMRQTARLARDNGVRLHTHLAETRDEEAYCLEHYGCRPLGLMERLGWVGPRRLVRPRHPLRRRGAGAAGRDRHRRGPLPHLQHAPRLGHRPGPRDADRRRSRVGLAVDGSASNDTSDMLGELRACLMLHRVLGGADAITRGRRCWGSPPEAAPALLGWPEIGRLERGKAADLVLVEMDRLDYAGALSDPLAAVIFSGMQPPGAHRDRQRRGGAARTAWCWAWTRRSCARQPTATPGG